MCKLRESFFSFGMFELQGFPQHQGLTSLFPIWEFKPIGDTSIRFASNCFLQEGMA
jgi:hypothetical protein